jgi:predicted RNase H-like HicB family nuclease
MSEPSRIPPQTETSFRAVVHAEPDGGYWAEVPDLPGCFTQGETLDEVYHSLAEAIASHLDLETAAIRISLLEMANDA